MSFLEAKDLHASIEGKEILTGLNLVINKGQSSRPYGPKWFRNRTFANVLLGHPKYSVTSGDILVRSKPSDSSTDERARKGIFLGFQYPIEIAGVGYSHFLRNAYNTLTKTLAEEQKNREVFLTVREFHEYVKRNLDSVGLDRVFLSRYLNEGFSGGEKKRSEVMQMLVLKPNVAILDEPDSGLDIDAVKSVAEAINKLIDTGAGVVVITHYARILRYLSRLDHVNVMAKGRIIKSGDKGLSEELETKGYGWLGLEEN